MNRFKNVPYDCKIEDIKPHKATGSFLTANGEKTLDEFDFIALKYITIEKTHSTYLGKGIATLDRIEFLEFWAIFLRHNGPGTFSVLDSYRFVQGIL